MLLLLLVVQSSLLHIHSPPVTLITFISPFSPCSSNSLHCTYRPLDKALPCKVDVGEVCWHGDGEVEGVSVDDPLAHVVQLGQQT